MDCSISEIIICSFLLVVVGAFLMLFRQLVQVLTAWKKQSNISTKTIEHRTQAYERMVIFLERIKPSQLITKFDKTLSVREFIFLTEKNILEEFNYNVSQQLYISQNSWQNIVNSKTKTIKILHSTYENIANDVKLEDYKTLFIMNYLNEGDFISECIENLKKEFLILHIK